MAKKIILFLLLAPCLAFPQDTRENADFKLAVSLYNDKLYDLALEQFRQFVSAYPNTNQGIEARFFLGLCQTKMSKHEDARITFQNFALVFQDHSKAPEAWWNVAEAYTVLNNFREAALAYERVKIFHPKSKIAPSALLKASDSFDRAGDKESSKKVLRTLTQEYGSSDVVLDARMKLADIYTSEGQHELARVEAKRVAEGARDPERAARALLMTAKALVSLGKAEDAKSVLNQIVTSYRAASGYHDALLNLGHVHRTTGNLEDAVLSWKSVADDTLKAPSNVRQEALLELGDASSVRNEDARALAFFERAARLKGHRTGEAFFRAARVAEETKNVQKASEYYLAALADTVGKADPRAILIGAIRGAVLGRNFNQAVQYSLRYRDQYTSDQRLPRVLLGAARIYREELNDPRRAADLCEQIVERFPSGEEADEALYGYALALKQSGAFEEAVRSLETLLRRFPASDLGREARQEKELIEIFDLKDKDGGLEHLALLTGDVIAQKPRGELAFRLGQIYFEELKDFVRAAQQYEIALKTPLDERTRADAWYQRGKSLQYLALKDQLKPSSRKSNYAGQAVAAFDSLLKTFPAYEKADDAFLSQVKLKLQLAATPSDVRKIGSDARRDFPASKSKERILLAVGRSYRTFKSPDDAAGVLMELLRSSPSAEVEASALFELARTKFEIGEKDSAVKILDSYLGKYKEHEFSAEAALLLAQIEAERGQAQRAAALYSTFEKNYPYASRARELDFLRAQAYFAAADFGQATANFERHLARLRDDYFSHSEAQPDLWFKLAESYQKTGRRMEAKRAYGAFLTRDTSAVFRGQAYFALAAIAREENNLELAARYLQEAGRYGSNSPDQLNRAALDAAELLLKSEDHANAIARFSELLGQMKGDSLQQYIQSRIIVAYFRLDNAKEADTRATAFVKSNPKAQDYAAEFEYERGKHNIRREEVDLAIKRFENIRRQYPKTRIVPETVYWLARAFEQKNQPQQAVRLYDSLLTKFPDHPIIPRVRLTLGNVYYNLEQWDAASKYYKAILENEKRSPELVQYAMSNLIMAYKEIGLFDAALQLTRNYIDRFPDDPDLIAKRVDIGVIFQKLGYYDQSILHLQNMMAGADADLEAELRYYIGEAYYYKGEYQQAILEFLKVPYLITRQTKVDWVATSYYMAGQSYEKMSKYDQAITMYKQIIERTGIDPTFKTAAQKEIDRVNLLVKGNGR